MAICIYFSYCLFPRVTENCWAYREFVFLFPHQQIKRICGWMTCLAGVFFFFTTQSTNTRVTRIIPLHVRHWMGGVQGKGSALWLSLPVFLPCLIAADKELRVTQCFCSYNGAVEAKPPPHRCLEGYPPREVPQPIRFAPCSQHRWQIITMTPQRPADV